MKKRITKTREQIIPFVVLLCLCLSQIIFPRILQAQQVCNINAGADRTFCVEIENFQLDGIVPNSVDPNTVIWTQDMSASIAALTISTPNLASTIVTHGVGQSTYQPGIYTFVLAGNCTVDNSIRTDTVVVTLAPPVTPAQIFEASNPTSPVTANPLIVCNEVNLLGQPFNNLNENGTWTFTGVAANQFNFNSNANILDASWNILSWYPNRCEDVQYTYTISNGNGAGCNSQQTVNVRHMLGDPNQVSIENVANGANICSNLQNFRGTRAHCDANVQWQINPLFVPQNNPAATFVVTSNGDDMTATFLESGSYEIIYDVNSNGICPSGTETIVVNVCLPQTAAINVYDGQTLCTGQQPSSIQLTAPFGGGTWTVQGANTTQVTLIPGSNGSNTSTATVTINDQSVQMIQFICTAPNNNTCQFPDGTNCLDDHFYQYTSYLAPNFTLDDDVLNIFCAEPNNFIRPVDFIQSDVGNADGLVCVTSVPAGSNIPSNGCTNISTALDFSVVGTYTFHLTTPTGSPCPDEMDWVVNVVDLVDATAGSSATDVCMDDVVLLVGNEPFDQNGNLVPFVDNHWVQTGGQPVSFVNGVSQGAQVSVTGFPSPGTYTFEYIFSDNTNGCQNSAITSITVENCDDLIFTKEAINAIGNVVDYVYVAQSFQWVVTIENPSSTAVTLDYQDLWPQDSDAACGGLIISHMGGAVLVDQVTIQPFDDLQLVYDARACADGGNAGEYVNCFEAQDVSTGESYSVCDTLRVLWGCPAFIGNATADHTGVTPFYHPLKFHNPFQDIKTMRFSVYYDPTFMSPVTTNTVKFSQAVRDGNGLVDPIPIITHNGNVMDIEFTVSGSFNITAASGGYTPIELGFLMNPNTTDCCSEIYSNYIDLIHLNGTISNPFADPGLACSDNPAAPLSISVTGGESCLMPNDQTTLTVSGGFDPLVSDIRWFDNTGGISTVANGPGDYWVTVRNQLGCFDSLNVVIDECVEICDSCAIEPFFTLEQNDECRYLLEGNNHGVTCPSQQYEYTITNTSNGAVFVLTGQNQIHTFTSSGVYEIWLRIFVIDPITGKVICENEYAEKIAVEGCESEPCKEPCILEPSFVSYSPIGYDECTLGFNGVNYGVTCPSQQYEYTITNTSSGAVSVLTGQNQIHTFTSSGVYEIWLRIFVIDPITGKVICENEYAEKIAVEGCESEPCKEPCILEPSFVSYSPIGYDECTLGFNGANYGVSCPSQQYAYQIFDDQGSLIHSYSGQNMIYEFPSSGTYEVCLELFVNNVDGERICEQEYCEKINFKKCPERCNVEASFKQGLAVITDRDRTFYDNSSTNGSIVSWSWDFGHVGSGSSNYSNLQNPTHRFGTGKYEVCLTVVSKLENGDICEDTHCQYVHVVSEGLEEVLSNTIRTSLKVSPVPSNGLLNIELAVDQSEVVSLEIFSLIGKQEQLLKDVELSEGINQLSWGLQGQLKNGSYILRITSKDEVISRHILIEN